MEVFLQVNDCESWLILIFFDFLDGKLISLVGRIARLYQGRNDFVLRLGGKCSASFCRSWRWHKSCRPLSKVRRQNIDPAAWFVDARPFGLVTKISIRILKEVSDVNAFSLFPYSAQGAIEIVQLMFKLQPVEKRISLFCTDIQKMTPLHCASMFDHPELVEFLVIEGADINALGKVLSHQRQRRTPITWLGFSHRQGASFADSACRLAWRLAHSSRSHQTGSKCSPQGLHLPESAPLHYHQRRATRRVCERNQRQLKVQLERFPQREGQHGLLTAPLCITRGPHSVSREFDSPRRLHQPEEQQQRVATALCGTLRPIQHGKAAFGLGKGNFHNQRMRRRRADSAAYCVAARTHQSRAVAAQSRRFAASWSQVSYNVFDYLVLPLKILSNQRSKSSPPGRARQLHANRRASTFRALAFAGSSRQRWGKLHF